MNVEFNDEELDMLRKVLADHLADLREEAHHTDARDYKDQLRKEEALLYRIQQKLQSSP